MHLSCNGCRVLRKGCTEDCAIRPCLQWIKSPESQANATFFLAKFYGRTGLLNLINAGPPHLRPSIFKSLLHEACGRIVNPVHGSVGLVSTGCWKLCQAAVESVLAGSPISEAPMDSRVDDDVSSPFKACDIRHVAKEEKKALDRSRPHRKLKSRTGFKRSRAKPLRKPKLEVVAESSGDDSVVVGGGDSKASQGGAASELGSVETVEDTLAKPNGVSSVGPELELGLSLFPVTKAQKEEDTKKEMMNDCDMATWTCDFKLGLPLL